MELAMRNDAPLRSMSVISSYIERIAGEHFANNTIVDEGILWLHGQVFAEYHWQGNQPIFKFNEDTDEYLLTSFNFKQNTLDPEPLH